MEDDRRALFYLANNTGEIGDDAHKMILRKFSAGVNMSFTMPLELHAPLQSLTIQATNPDAPEFTPHSIPEILAAIS